MPYFFIIIIIIIFQSLFGDRAVYYSNQFIFLLI